MFSPLKLLGEIFCFGEARLLMEDIRVAREVGTEGKLGGQASVQGVSGTWKALTDNVNTMAENVGPHLTAIAKLTSSVS